MKTAMTPSKHAQNEISCELTSQALGDPYLKNGQEPYPGYKRVCSGFGDESINQTPVSKGASPNQQTKPWVSQITFPSIFGCVAEITPIKPATDRLACQ